MVGLNTPVLSGPNRVEKNCNTVKRRLERAGLVTDYSNKLKKQAKNATNNE